MSSEKDTIIGSLTSEVIDNSEMLWFLNSTSESRKFRKKPIVKGSAVHIRLKDRVSKSVETYLLTSAHVIRDSDENNIDGYGPILEDISCWQCGDSFKEKLKKEVTVFQRIKPYKNFEAAVPADRRNQVSSDWVILQFKDSSSKDITSSLPNFGKPDKVELDLYGFPGGEVNFKRDVVRPTKMSGSINYNDTDNGVVTVISNQSLEGMSGGGFFDKNTSNLIGIHRSKIGEGGTLQAVSIGRILQNIGEQEFDVVSSTKSVPSTKIVSSLLTQFIHKISLFKKTVIKYKSLLILSSILMFTIFFGSIVFSNHKFKKYCSQNGQKIQSNDFYSSIDNKDEKSAKNIAMNMINTCGEDSHGFALMGSYHYSKRNFNYSYQMLDKALRYSKNRSQEYIEFLNINKANTLLELRDFKGALHTLSGIGKASRFYKNTLDYHIGKTLINEQIFSKTSLNQPINEVMIKAAVTYLQPLSIHETYNDTDDPILGKRALMYLSVANTLLGQTEKAKIELTLALTNDPPLNSSKLCEILNSKSDDFTIESPNILIKQVLIKDIVEKECS